MENLVYLNGEYIPIDQAKVSVLDRGFLFGDGVYEVIPAYAGRLFRLEDHMARLQRSREAIGLELDWDLAKWQEVLAPLADPEGDRYVYLQVTRGVAPKRDHAFPSDPKPTVFAMSAPIAPFPDRALGVKAVTLDDNRWRLCQVKSTALLANVLLKQQAVDRNAAEAILVRDGKVTEGAASNVFAVLDGLLVTPIEDNRILAGITRMAILELAAANGIAFEVRDLAVEELARAEEIWFASSTREIVPVSELDGRIVGESGEWPLWERMHQLYQQCKVPASSEPPQAEE